MNPDDVIITQMGLLLTQLRFARHAFENIERSTAHYAGVAVNLTGGGTALGAPPLLNGALKVYVTNIAEIVSGGSGAGLGGLVEGLFGGIGRFLGGFLGGIAGGLVGAIAFPYDLYLLDHMASTAERIVQALGMHPATTPAAAGANAQAAGSASLTDSQLDRFTGAINDLGMLLGTASTPAADDSNLSTSGRLWLGVFHELTSVINGLILLVPILVGAVAWLLRRLTDIKAAIVDVLAFAIENALVLRGVLLVTLGDTIAMAGDIAASVLGIVATAIDAILVSIIRVIETALTAAVTAIQVLGAGLRATIDGLMTWLRDGLGNFLLFLGNTRIFRLILHLVEVLPLMLPGLLRLMDRDVDSPAARGDLNRLTAAAAIGFPGIAGGGVAGGTASTIAPFPDLGALAMPANQIALLQNSLAIAGATLRSETGSALSTAQGAMRRIGATVRERLTDDRALQTDLDRRRGVVAGQAAQLADALGPARRQPPAQPGDAGLNTIAGAYQSWLEGGGMATLMGAITDQLQRTTPTAGPAVERSLAGAAVGASAHEPAPATIEIGEVVIEIGAPLTSATSAPSSSDPAAAHAVVAVASWMRDVRARGGSIDDPSNVPLIPDSVGVPA